MDLYGFQAFLGRFNDISVAIRQKCVQYTMHFLINHAELIDDITETLKARQHDSEETVRYEVVIAIVSTAKKDFDIVSRSEDLLNFVKERTLDKKFKIRKEAMAGLAMIYKRHLSNPHGVPEATKNAVKWIKDKILHGYYMPGIEDRLLVERLLNTCLVPYNLEPEERMKKLYLLFATIDENASKAFIEVQKHQMQVCVLVFFGLMCNCNHLAGEEGLWGDDWTSQAEAERGERSHNIIENSQHCQVPP